jgi:hypothetical protein
MQKRAHNNAHIEARLYGARQSEEDRKKNDKNKGGV